jgi:hypothetical protein
MNLGVMFPSTIYSFVHEYIEASLFLLAGCLAGQFAVCLAGWLGGWVAGWLVGWMGGSLLKAIFPYTIFVLHLVKKKY